MSENLITAITELDGATYLTKVYSGGHFIYVDEPEEIGGTDEGMNPAALLLASLGSCTAITLRMYADRKGIVLHTVKIHLTICKEEDMSAETKIERKLELTGELTEDQRNRLITIADKCPIHKMLTNPIQIDTSLS
jgi:putative redox protein